MDSRLKRVSTVGMSKDEWLAFRFNGIGGSEISTIVGLNPYESNVKLFYKKLGEVEQEPENRAMFWGKRNEDTIADVWQYYDPKNDDPDNYIVNYNNETIIRKCHKVNAYIINPDYPYLFASVDRIINKTGDLEEGVLDCKTIREWAAKMWIAGTPPMYLAQIQIYMFILGLKYAILATLRDGNHFEELRFERNDEFIKYLVDAAADFWDRVTRARILKQEGKPYEQLEPEPNNQDAYEGFLSEKYKNSKEICVAPSAHFFTLGTEYMDLNKEIDTIEDRQTVIANEIKAYMKDADTMDFGKASGKITWKTNVKGSRVFKISLKAEKPQEQAVAA